MPGPYLPLLGPLVPALLILAGLRRWQPAAALTGAVSAAVLAVLTGTMPAEADVAAPFSGNSALLPGMTLELTEGVQGLFVLLCAALAVLFLLSLRWPQGQDFVVVGLATLSPIALMLMARPLPVALLGLLTTGVVSAVLIQGGRPAVTLGALRFLVITVLALPLFLVAGWMLASDQLIFVGTVWRLLLVGIALLLGGFPFHIWVRTAVAEARPLVVIFVFAIVQTAVVVFIMGLLQQYPAVANDTGLLPALRWSAAITLLFAGLLATGAADDAELLSYLVLADMGAVLLAVSFPATGADVALHMLGQRFGGLLLVIVARRLLALPDLVASASGEHPLTVPAPWPSLLLAYGALSLVGFPLTPGFAGRWLLTGLLATVSPWLALPLLLATAGGVVGILRRSRGWHSVDSGLTPPHLKADGLAALLLLIAIFMSVFPGPLLNFASRLAAGLP